MKKLNAATRVLTPVVAHPDDADNTRNEKKSKTASLVLLIGHKLQVKAVGPLAVISVSVISTMAIVAAIVMQLPIT